MAKRGESSEATKKLPQEMLDRVAAELTAALDDTGFSAREAEKAWGIDISSLSKAKNAKGAVGMHLLLKLRELRRKSIDALLGLPPIASPAAKPDRVPADLDLEYAETIARSQGVTDSAIAAAIRDVATRQPAIPGGRRERRIWWGDRFLEAAKAELEAQAAVRQVTNKRSDAPPATSRGRQAG